ncbi:MAG: hypothetical protein AAGA80_10665 [Cyanobacteria bacterium P01_F01_bin.143]
MDNIQITGLKENLDKIVLEELKNLQQQLDVQGSAPDRTLIENLIQETRFLFEQVVDDSRIKNHDNLKKIVSGFLLLSEVIDVFIDLFSIEELNQIYDSVENIFNTSSRDIKKYFEDGFNLSNLVTQLRAYSSLILIKIEKYIKQQKNLYLENKLKEMAEDPEIQAEMKAINE